MRKFLCLLLVNILILLSSTSVLSATYEMLEPQEVEGRSQFIVRGTYIFDMDALPGNHMYNSYEFIVTDVIKGDAKTGVMIVGLQIFDTSWVREHQENGGDFLIFVDKESVNELFVPVLGTNGLVPLFKDKVIDEDKKRAKYFQKIVDGQEQQSGLLYFFIAATVVIILSLIINRRATM
ncbi:MAG: hypothetical protein LPK00_00345 [Bacillaceae bacterium]|nr:hypothetical protein [Bacillaceae bacterium]